MGYLKWLQDTRLLSPEPEAGGAPAASPSPAPAASPASPAAAPAAAPATPEFSVEQKAYMDSLVNTAVTKAVTETNVTRDKSEAGLRKNKDEILAQKKKLDKQLADNKLEQQMIDGDVDGARAEIKAGLEAEYTEKLTALQSTLDNTVLSSDNEYMDRVLDTHLTDLRVKSTYQGDLKNSLKARSTIVKAEDGTKSLLIDGKPAAEHFTTWSNSEVAKDYVVAPTSSGGGGQGSGGTGGTGSSYEILSKLSGIEQIDKAYELKNKK